MILKCHYDKIYDKLRHLLEEEFKIGKWPWYMYGDAGCGKTFAAACIYERFQGNGNVFLWDCAKLLNDAVDYHVQHRESVILRTIKEAAFIVIDDIVTRELSDSQLDRLRNMINARGDKPMIITSNHNPQQLAVALKDARTTSRICSGTLIHVLGQDRRLQNARIREA